MGTGPDNSPLNRRGVKSCLVAVSDFLGSLLEFAVKGDSTNGSIYVENPPGVPIDVDIGSASIILEPLEAEVKTSSITILAGQSKGANNFIPHSLRYQYDITITVNNDDAGSIVKEISFFPYFDTVPAIGKVYQANIKSVNLLPDEIITLYGPTLSTQDKPPSFHAKGWQIGIELNSIALVDTTITYSFFYNRRRS